MLREPIRIRRMPWQEPREPLRIRNPQESIPPGQEEIPTSSVGEQHMVVEEEPATFDLQESSPPGQEEIPTSSVGEEPTMSIRQRQWWAKLEELKEFQRANGTLVVRQSENKSLYLWLHRQKEFMQKDVSSMNDDQVQRFNELKAIGFE